MTTLVSMLVLPDGSSCLGNNGCFLRAVTGCIQASIVKFNLPILPLDKLQALLTLILCLMSDVKNESTMSFLQPCTTLRPYKYKHNVISTSLSNSLRRYKYKHNVISTGVSNSLRPYKYKHF